MRAAWRLYSGSPFIVAISGQWLVMKDYLRKLQTVRVRRMIPQSARLIASARVPTKIRLTAQVASKLNQFRDTNLRPR